MADPTAAMSAAQRKALQIAADAYESVKHLAASGVSQPEELVGRVTTLVAAVGDLAASTTVPMEMLIAHQRNLAKTMAAFAELQVQMAQVVGDLAASHAAVVEALDAMSKPAIAVSDLIRSEPAVKQAQARRARR